MIEGPWWDREWCVLPVVEWTGPDGLVRRGVPRGTQESTPAPPLGDALAISYAPQDPGWFALPTSVVRGPGWLAAGVVGCALGLVLLLAAGGVGVVVSHL